MSSDYHPENNLDGGQQKPKKEKFSVRHPMLSWALIATSMTIVLSSLFSFLSETVLLETSIVVSFFIAVIFILLNVVTDTLGVSVTACDKVPFLAMASKKVKGAKEALILIDNADKISNICSDIIGDICGIMSGAVGANIVTQILILNQGSLNSILISVVISTMIAAVTVFFKAIGKYLATRYYEAIVLFSSKILKIFIKKKEREKTEISKNKNHYKGESMEKISIPKICNTLSIILIISFVVKSIVDYFNYSPTLNSAPFYVWILVNIFCFLIPAIIIFFVGIIIKRKIA